MPDKPNILKFLPSHYDTAKGTFLYGLLKAISGLEGSVKKQIEACIDQLFVSSASGKYLIRLAEERGFALPSDSGLDIRAYRQLIPSMTSDPKQIRDTIENVVEDFYTVEKTRALMVSGITGPYSFVNGDNIVIMTDYGTITITIEDHQVADITNVSGSELANLVNSNTDSIFADTVTDRQTLKESLRLFSKTRGTSSFIQIVGGTMQNVLQFPTIIANVFANCGFILSKIQDYDDHLTITWDGINGSNPRFYLVEQDDVLTIRNLSDNVYPISLLNGSWPIIEAGYDYVVISNPLYGNTAGSFVLPEITSFLITSSKKNTIFDQMEYALTSETKYNTTTVTVPSIPPLVKRFLQGSAHLRGNVLNVTSFDRSSISFQDIGNADSPSGSNKFLLSSQGFRIDFTKKFYKTLSSDDLTNPTFQVDSGDIDYVPLPYTSPTAVSTDPIIGDVGSNEYTITFPYKHGLQENWGFNLVGATGIGNITSPDLNEEHIVKYVVDDFTLKFQLFGSNGSNKSFQGFSFTPVDVYRYPVFQTNYSDFYLQFANNAALVASGLTIGSTFRLDASVGTNTDPFFGPLIRQKTYTVVAIGTITVDFVTGYGVGPSGQTISATTGYRSGSFGGTVQYYFDQTSQYNISYVMTNLQAMFLDAQGSQNPEYLGSYIYDPDNSNNSLTVSGYITAITNEILEGSSDNIIPVNSVTDVFLGQNFPENGELVIDYGSDSQEGPIKYIATISGSPSQIVIDPSYVFKKTHLPNSNIQYIYTSETHTPTPDGKDYPAYVTGSTQGRNTLFKLIELLVAAGIFVESEVISPQLSYSDIAIDPYQ